MQENQNTYAETKDLQRTENQLTYNQEIQEHWKNKNQNHAIISQVQENSPLVVSLKTVLVATEKTKVLPIYPPEFRKTSSFIRKLFVSSISL
jgi:hypothetical protein